ncbi:MAG: DMT family transporter [Actinobacteria bacterium]|nr:DMT family transporter [Actinomycetota bacterium]
MRSPRPWRMLWVTFAWGSCYLAISIGLQDAPVLWLAALRTLVAAAVLLTVAGVQRVARPRGQRTWLLVAVMGLVNVALAYGAMFSGIIGLSTGAASVLANAQPLLILFPAWLFFREAPTPPVLAAMLVGVIGLLLVAIPTGFGTGAWLALTASLAVTAGTLISRIIDAEPLTVAAWQFVIGGVVLAVVALAVEGIPQITWSPRFVVALLYMSVLGTAATNVAWITEARAARLDQLTTWTLLVPVFGVILSTVVLREAQSVWAWIGTGVVVAALILLILTAGRPRSSDFGIQAPKLQLQKETDIPSSPDGRIAGVLRRHGH